MRRLSLFLFAGLLLSILVPQLLAQDTRQPASSVLQVVDTEPLTGQELELDGSITVYFDRNLNCETVMPAFRIVPEIVGNLDCAGNAITFTPDAGFERAATYRIAFDKSLEGADGSHLLEPYVLELDTVGFIAVSETFPAPDSVDIEPDTTLTIIFNRPVVPLTILEDRGDLPDPLTITPSIEGTGTWLNTSIYVFEPAEAFAGNTTYQVTVDAGLEAVDGALLRDDYRFSFTTQPPMVLEFSPDDGARGILLNRRVQVRFNMAMDRASVEANFYMLASLTREAVSGEFEWADDDAGFIFTPEADLQLNTTYTLGFTDGVQSASGGPGGLESAEEWSFTTVPEPDIVNTSPQNNDQAASPYRAGFTLYFASPMNPDTLADKITIEPEPEREPAFYYRDWSDAYEVSFLTYPSATYTVTVAPGAEDIYGNAIDEEYTFTYTTAPYDPEVSLNTPGPVGFYNASRQPTQVFVKYRNMDSFDLLLYQIPLANFAPLMTNETNYYYDLAYSVPLDGATLLRQWTVDGTEVPNNALRYDLLEFGADVFSLDCAAALPSRLSAGETALVVAEPDPVRARSAPVDGEIVELLYKDYALPILGQAICGEDGLLWWPVQLRDESQAWVAESVGDEYLLEPQDPASGVQIPLTDAEGQALPPGIYYLGTRSGQFQDQNHIMVVATANIVLKNSIDSVMAWVTDVQTGQPIANAPITIYGTNNRQLATGTTDADGMLIVDVPAQESVYERFLAVLQTEDQFGIGYSEFTQGIEPYNFDQSFDFFPSLYRIYAYTDRPVYRPGQPVYFRGIARSQDDVSYTVPGLQTIPVTIRDDQGNLIFDENVPLNEYGTFEGEITLDADASLGYYYISAELPGRSEYDGSY
ncbi:MAG: Ig-like domain-containing protein, partial [Anaerolineae bacterium]|nr:Ig-like domain-containing protein [Anaerolineae bacterium]